MSSLDKALKKYVLTDYTHRNFCTPLCTKVGEYLGESGQVTCCFSHNKVNKVEEPSFDRYLR